MSSLKEKSAIVVVVKEEEGTFGRIVECIRSHKFIYAYRIRETDVDELEKTLKELSHRAIRKVNIVK
jgi:hypothetical protein